MNIAIVLLPEALSSTISGPADVLLTASLVGGLPWTIETVSSTAEPVTCFNGMSITPGRSITDGIDYDMVIVPSILVGNEGLLEPHSDIVDWLQDQAKKNAQIVSICTGAFLLAKTKLLDGKQATTHWAFAEVFRKLHPEVNLNEKLTVVDNGETLCCSAGSAWQDLVLHILSKHVDQSIIMDLTDTYQLQRHNMGQQSFCGLPSASQSDPAIERARVVLRENIVDQSVLDMAVTESGLNSRTFQRRFKAHAGTTPSHYLQLLRVNKSKKILTFESMPIDLICYEVGYEDASHLRRIFKKETGMSMREYRLRFSLDPEKGQEIDE